MAIKYLAGNRIQGSSNNTQAKIDVAVSDQVLRYDFEETSGVTLNDKIGSKDGELKDGSLVSVDGASDTSNGWRFDDTKVQIDQSLGTVSNISLSIWVKKFDGDRCPIAIDSSTSNFGTGLWFEDAVGSLGLRIGHQSSGTDLNTQTSIPQDGEWHHVVFIAGSDEARIYLDGVSIGNNSGSHSSGAYGGAVDLAYNGSSSAYGNCALDHAIWFNKKLSQSEVTSLYNADEKTTVTNIPENSIFEETDTGEHYLRAKYGWFKFGDSGSMPNHRGIFTGGSSTDIDYITIATLGNGADFGDGGSTGKMGAAVGNGTLGIYGGDDNVLNQVTIATKGNSTDFGDLTGIGGNATACADATRGVWFRGNINYITMASASNATDWGHDRVPNAGDPCAFADTTRGIVAGGETNVGGWHDINDMDYITIQTISATTDFGDMTDVKRQLSGVANDTYGFTMCGYNGSSYLNVIDYVTIQSLGNATDFGDLTQARTAQNSACGDSTRAVLGGGSTGSNVNTIDYFTMGTSGNASDFGDLTSARTRVMSCSDYVK